MIGPWPGFEPGQTGWLGPGPAGRLFLRPPTLTAGNFAALWPTDPKFLALKDLNPFKTVSKVQKTSSILRVGFALSKWPHLHRAYVVGGCLFNLGTVQLEFDRFIRTFWESDAMLPQLLSDAKQRIDDIVWIPSVFMGGFCIQKCIVGVNWIVKILAKILM